MHRTLNALSTPLACLHCCACLIFIMTVPHRLALEFRSGEYTDHLSTVIQRRFQHFLQCGQVPNSDGK